MTDGQNETRSRDDSARDIRVMRILDDFLRRRAAGEPVSQAALLAAHPDLADDLREHLELVGHLQPADRAIDEMVERGDLRRSADPRYRAELGPYQITRVIGRGGMGVVLEAHDASLDRRVALKLLRPDLVQDTVALARFEREAKAAAALRHPNIVTVYAIHRPADGPEAHPTLHYIAMEYVDGPSLAEVLAQARRHEGTEARSDVAADARVGRSEPEAAARDPSEPEAPARGPADASACLRAFVPPCLSAEFTRRVFRELLAALDAAHRAGLIHRDVKSANILLDLHGSVGPPWPTEPSAGEAPAATTPSCLRASVPSCLPLVKLADFGLARMRSSQTKVTLDGSVLGTPEYMSPEQARGDADIDHRTDLYSAGVVLYEMLTGVTPFRCDTPTATIHRILHEEPPDPRKLDQNVDPVLANLALRLMAKRPEHRFTSVAEVLVVLDSHKSARSVVRSSGRLLRFAWLALVLALVSVGAGLLYQLCADQGPPSTHARRIEKIKMSDDKDEILAYYGTRSVPEVFHRFSEGFGTSGARKALLLDVDGRGQQIVAANTGSPIDLNGDVLVAFDAEGLERWKLSLTPSGPNEPVDWPNCEPLRAGKWTCVIVEAADLDGAPGQELVAVAQDPTPFYPARVSIIDPRAGTITATFWHFGHIKGILVVPDYFPGRRPALLAWGLNNKLDGFETSTDDPTLELQPEDDAPVAAWDSVPVVMILDPLHMDGGLGPPRTHRVPHDPSVLPYAYAWLDRAAGYTEGARAEGSTLRREPAPSDLAQIVLVTPDMPSGDPSEPWFKVNIYRITKEHPAPDPMNPGVGLLTVDRNLEVRAFVPCPTEPFDKTPAHWKSLWHPCIREGERVSE